jgi:adenosine deaminase
MINSQLSDKFQRMPKIELHVHVEGAVNAEAYFNLAQKNKVKLPAENS